MNETKRPREFWIKATRVRNGVKSYTATLAPISVAGEIHVIEKSEYDDLKDRYDLVVDSDNAWREKAEAIEEKLRVAVEALGEINSIGTVYVEPDNWSCSKNGGPPEISDYESVDLSEIAELAISKIKGG